MKFDRLVESILLEMPYIHLDLPSGEVDFDLELELYRNNLDGFVHLLKSILSSIEVVDKYGDKLHLPESEREYFISVLRDDQTLGMFLKKYHNTDINKILVDYNL